MGREFSRATANLSRWSTHGDISGSDPFGCFSRAGCIDVDNLVPLDIWESTET